jgi:hypothetical protein
MRPQTPYSAPPQSSGRRKSRLPFWLFVVFSLAFSCVIVSVLSVLLLNHVSSSLTPPPDPTLPPAPTTPPLFGLSGQATCRHFSPPTSSPWLAVAGADAEKYQLDTLAFEWQIWQESKFNPDAVSTTNAVGIAQFEPTTAAELGIDPTDPEQSLDGAARLDRERLDTYAQRGAALADHYGGSSAHYAYGMVLAAYNGGPNGVERAWANTFTDQDGNQVWPPGAWDWLAQMNTQTQNYVPDILGCL